MEIRKLRKKLFGRSAGSLLVLAQRAELENFIDQSVYQVDKAIFIPEEDWKY